MRLYKRNFGLKNKNCVEHNASAQISVPGVGVGAGAWERSIKANNVATSDI